ncbi:hypothetical protein NLJ89_g11211 [Agrocybe chaxingu]|uniref:Uncharacterized protein n=1 Tax=Agrocybe chaxingu TaxID=84603 RepID=A0A9W8JPS6_9AGAR|nr:hypothetical protein NLJ89_g11211 [Agrocybe chaxingu]
MVNPGSFRGLRKEFLQGEKKAYADAVAGGYAKDAIAIIQRRFFKRFPIDLPVDQEPAPEALVAVDDDEAEPDQVQPNKDELGPEEYAKAVERVKERQKLIVYRKGIRRWLAYQYMRDHDIDPKDTGAENPYRVLLQKLTGKGLNRPRLKNGQSAWRKTMTAEIDQATRQRAREKGANMKTGLAPIREQVAKEMFQALDASEREEWVQTAKEDHEELVKKWETDVKGPLSTAAEDRQRCILGLTQFVQPILDLICEATGWKASFVAGGPEPAHGGRLNMLSVHSGTTSGDIKMNFGRAEHARYKKYFVPMYADFLRKSYSPEDCRACALKNDEDPFTRVADIELPSGVDVDPIPFQIDKPLLSTSGTPSPHSAQEQHPVVEEGSRAAASLPNVLPVAANKSPIPAPVADSRPSDPTQNRSLAVEEGSQMAAASVSNALRLPVAVNKSPVPPVADSRRLSPVPSPPPSRPPSRQPSPPASPAHQSLQGDAHQDCITMVIENDPARPITQGQASTSESLAIQTPLLESSSTSALLDTREDITGTTSPLPVQRSDPANATLHTIESPTSTSVRPPTLPSQEQDNANARRISANPTANTTSLKRKGKATGWKRKRTKEDEVGPTATADVRPSKRNRDDSNASPTTALSSANPAASTSTAREWFEKAKGQFRAVPFGEPWLRLLEEWEAFQEEVNAFADNRMLSAKRRPKSIALWIGRARNPTYRPSNPNPKIDETDYKAWWMGLQPEWRVVKGRVVNSSMEGDWSCLQLPGVNGVLSVIAALFFWGLGATSKARTRKVWTAAVQECTTVFSQLRMYAPSSS